MFERRGGHLMTVTTRTTVAEIAREVPRAIPIFQRNGIDFCCGGRRTLSEVCSELGVGFDAIVDQIGEAGQEPAGPLPDWATEPLADLIDRDLLRYHAVLRDELPRLEMLADKVATVHASRHPELLPSL